MISISIIRGGDTERLAAVLVATEIFQGSASGTCRFQHTDMKPHLIAYLTHGIACAYNLNFYAGPHNNLFYYPLLQNRLLHSHFQLHQCDQGMLPKRFFSIEGLLLQLYQLQFLFSEYLFSYICDISTTYNRITKESSGGRCLRSKQPTNLFRNADLALTGDTKREKLVNYTLINSN